MHKNSNLSVAFCVSYAYDALGRPVTRGADRFGYNGRSEVVSALTDGIAANYAYDAVGNRLVSTNGGFNASYLANALNQYAAVTADGDDMPVTYDRWGNMTRFGVYSYSCTERNNRVGVVSTTLPNGRVSVLYDSGYDGLDRRVYKSVSSPDSVGHSYYYNGWNPVIERVQSSGGTTETVRYVWGKDLSGSLQGAGGVGGLLATQVGGAWYFPAYDANGNITQYVDEDGHVVASYTYDAFGNTVAESGAMADAFPFRFSTKYYDSESGLYYYGYRFYSPKLGRWLTRDPIEEAGGVNLYGFCGNDGVGKVDVLGLAGKSPRWCCDICDPQKNKPRVMNLGIALRPAFHGKSPRTESIAMSLLDDVSILTYFQLGAGIASSLTEAEGVLAGVLLTVLDSGLDSARAAGYQKEIIKAIESVQEKLKIGEGVVIWVYVKWKKCERKRCWMVGARNDWGEYESWHQCEASNREYLGFEVDDKAGIGEAIPMCIAEAIREEVK